MGYYDGDDLNFLYFMATNFATSDRWFQPAMSRTDINREYLLGATSGGYAYPNGTVAADTPQLKSETIFEDLQNAGVTWKIYVNPEGTGCSGPPYKASCLIKFSYLSNFTYAQTVVSKYPQNVQPISQYFTDLQNGTLPQVAYFWPASDAGLDEHGTDTDTDAPTNVQAGEAYVESLVTALMNSSSWSSSVLFWTYDESGGLYDHVSPQPMPSPDGIKPVDLMPGDICTDSTGPTCDFTWTGYRIPLVVVSPYAQQNYVSHTVADFTAMLKFIETRWNLPALTARDAAQMDMTEFFDFDNSGLDDAAHAARAEERRTVLPGSSAVDSLAAGEHLHGGPFSVLYPAMHSRLETAAVEPGQFARDDVRKEGIVAGGDQSLGTNQTSFSDVIQCRLSRRSRFTGLNRRARCAGRAGCSSDRNS